MRSAARQAARVLALGAGSASASIAGDLERAGYEVTSVSSAPELARSLEQRRYDAVVLDFTGSPRPRASLLVEVGRAMAGGWASRRAPRPFVLALTSDGARAGGGRVEADAWLAGEPREHALRELEGAIAVRRLQEAREEIERLRSAVLHARHTAHELAQPLTTILARAQLLMGSLGPDDPHHRAISIICREADRLARLIEGFQKLKEVARDPGPPPPPEG